MKKLFLGLSAMVAMIASASAFANSHEEKGCLHDHAAPVARVAAQGKRCNGSVGCDCTGFSPITNGKVWQQAYCKRCGHKKSSHK